MRNKTNVEYFDEQYYVNPEKKTVVCALSFIIDLNKIPGVENFIDFDPIQQYLSTVNYGRDCYCDDCNDEYCYDCENCFDAGVVVFTVKGKSKASGGDEFNETVGRKLANTRAQMKAFNVANKFYNELINIIYCNMVEGLDDLCIGASNAWFKCSKHEDEIVKPYMETK